MFAIAIVNAKKNYGDLPVLKGINLNVREGEFFGLLGPNGAGKTTLIHSIVGLCRLDEGTVSVFGFDSRKDFIRAHSLVGFAPQDINLDRFFSIRKILLYHAGFFAVPKRDRSAIVDELLEKFHLAEKGHVPYYRLSGGMQKKLLVAKAMVTRPRILILDEPTAGIDVEQRHELWNYLRDLNRDGTTVILTTHYIDEAEALCRRVGIMHLGEIRETDTPGDLINRYCQKRVMATLSKKIDPKKIGPGPFRIEASGQTLMGVGSDVGLMIGEIQKIISCEEGSRILDLHVERGSLEEVFLKVTGRKMESVSVESEEMRK